MMAINSMHVSLYERITSHRYFIFSLICIFLVILISYFIFWPIVGYDTDLWYHLSGGRYFWENGKIPADAFFSYVIPPKAWYDYYWLFQVITYKIFQGLGYHGLIIFRCILFSLTVLFITILFSISRKSGWISVLAGIFLIVAYAMGLTVRELLVRPHLFSYLFIVVFFYILEIKREKIWLLPILGIVWCNIHGIEYPVMIVIILAYLADLFYKDITKTVEVSASHKKEKWILILTIYTVFFTPHIIELIKTPFSAAMYQNLYVNELTPLEFKNVVRFSAWPFLDLIGSFQNILVISPIIILGISVYKRKLRISSVVLMMAAIFLLTRHNRFIYEYILLTIPINRNCLDLFRKDAKKENRSSMRYFAPVAIIFITIIVPLSIYGSYFKHRPDYPLTQMELPIGVGKFLNKIDAGGYVMNEPNTGGYMQWALNKKYKIFMDMQLSIFSDQDFALINNAMSDETTFCTFVRLYNPSFICVGLGRQNFKKFINNFPEYRQIFFDDQEVLYVNSKHYPKISEMYKLEQLNVFEYKDIDYEKERKERLASIMDDALKIINIYPGCAIANVIIANILINNKQYEKSLVYSDVIIRRYPNIAKGYILKADALRGLERVPEAIENYLLAIDRDLKPDESKVYWNLHTCYGHLKMYKRAYWAISKFLNPFDPEANYRDIYALAITAAAAGKKRDAVNFLKIAEYKVPPEDKEFTNKVKESLGLLDNGNR